MVKDVMVTIINSIEKNGFNVEYETKTIPFQILLNRSYRPDFIINDTYLEVKGMFSTADRRKHKAIKELYPNLKIVMVFQRSKNKISKTSKTTNGEWCDKNGIEWIDFSDLQEFLEGLKND